MHSPWGKQSGAHINPAVTWAFFRLRQIKLWDAVFYSLAQLGGAVATVQVMWVLIGRPYAHADVDFVATRPPGTPPGRLLPCTFAALGYSAEPGADSDFVALRETAGLAEVERHLARNREPLVHGTVAFTLPERDLLAEGVTNDRPEGAFYVSSVHRRKIVRLTRDGRSADFAVLDAPASVHRWVSGRPGAPSAPGSDRFGSPDAGLLTGRQRRSALLRFNLESGKLSGRYPVPEDGRAHALGDVAITSEGEVYASDSRVPAIYHIALGRDSLERFLESPSPTTRGGSSWWTSSPVRRRRRSGRHHARARDRRALLSR